MVAVHGCSASDYQAHFDTLVPLGFRLRWVQAYGEGSEPRFNGVWEQSPSASWEARHGIAPGDYQPHFDAKVREGLRLRCVSAYLDGGSGITYATLWDRNPTPAWESHHGIPAAQYQQHFTSMVGRGFRLVHLNACGTVLGPLFATIWEQRGGSAWEARHGLDSAAYQTEFNQLLRRGYRLRQVCSYDVGGEAHYAGLWDAEQDHPWQGRHGQDADTYQLDFDDLRLRGYRPSCVSGCPTRHGSRFAAVFDNPEFGGAVLELIEGEAARFMDRFLVPGLSVAFCRQGRLVYARAFGHADAARQEPLRTRHRMRIASVAKPMTAVATYLLMQRGNLGLSDAVFGPGAILGTGAGTQPYGANLLAIRLHHLLEHTSGAWTTRGPATRTTTTA